MLSDVDSMRESVWVRCDVAVAAVVASTGTTELTSVEPLGRARTFTNLNGGEVRPVDKGGQIAAWPGNISPRGNS